MSLDMFGHIDDVFETATVTRQRQSDSGYVNGRWVEGDADPSTHKANVQPTSMREREALEKGGDRLLDTRTIRINDGSTSDVLDTDTWIIPGLSGVYQTQMVDNRPTRNYCKVIVSLIDDSPS